MKLFSLRSLTALAVLAASREEAQAAPPAPPGTALGEPQDLPPAAGCSSAPNYEGTTNDFTA